MRLLTLAPHGPAPSLREQVARLDDIGVDGVLAGDHLFHAGGGDRRTAHRGYDPLTLLAAISALSDKLILGTIVINTAWIHPAHVLRSFNQLAVMAGGERVLAGLGGGWNPEEFEALAMRMPPFSKRMDHLEKACQLARGLWDGDVATVEGFADVLPFAPKAEVPPRLFLGGGSDRVLEMAGRYADALDLNGTPDRGKLRGAVPSKIDAMRRMTTKIGDLETSVAKVRAAAEDAGRAMPRLSVFVTSLAFTGEVTAAEEQFCAGAGVEHQPLDQCPYALIGDEPRIRDQLAERKERLGLDTIICVPSELERVVQLVHDA